MFDFLQKKFIMQFSCLQLQPVEEEYDMFMSLVAEKVLVCF